MDLIEFAERVRGLKNIKRKGWAVLGVKGEHESVADHSFMLAILVYIYSRKMGLDTDKAIRMALLHDLCEVYTKDIVTRLREEDQEMSNKEKKALEREGMEELISGLPRGISKEMRSLWEEFEGRESPEAKLVKDLDSLEMIIQASYHRKRNDGDLQEFFDVADREIKTPEIREAFEKMRAEL